MLEELLYEHDPMCGHDDCRRTASKIAGPLSDFIAQALANETEDCAKIADTFDDQWTKEWRAGHKSNSHTEGKSDGASEIAWAIRSRRGRETK